MKKLSFLLVFSLIFLFFVTACNSESIDNTEELKERDDRILVLEQRIKELEREITELPRDALPYRVIEVMSFIKNKDMAGLSDYIHPSKGIRFSPYFYIDLEEDKVFSGQQIVSIMESEDMIRWGNYDGSGEAIDLKFSDYFNRFVYDEDFANPQIIGNNTPLGGGNTIDNIKEAYPDSHFIEFHFSMIDPQYAGIDWRSLRLVFEKQDDTWYLTGIIHGEWTI